jgi:hypothetical protein
VTHKASSDQPEGHDMYEYITTFRLLPFPSKGYWCHTVLSWVGSGVEGTVACGH